MHCAKYDYAATGLNSDFAGVHREHGQGLPMCKLRHHFLVCVANPTAPPTCSATGELFPSILARSGGSMFLNESAKCNENTQAGFGPWQNTAAERGIVYCLTTSAS